MEPVLVALGHDMPLQLESEEIIGWRWFRCPTHGLDKKDAGMGNYTPSDIDEPELAERAFELQGVASVLQSHRRSP
jgi:hypothetical protein